MEWNFCSKIEGEGKANMKKKFGFNTHLCMPHKRKADSK